MDELLLQQNIRVAPDQDRVVLTIGRLDVPMPYAASFKLAQGLRLASKHIMSITGENVHDWRARSELDQQPIAPEVSSETRRTLPGRFEWRVDVDGERVKLVLGNTTIGLHFTTALKVSEWIRAVGRQARAWAGDDSRHQNIAGWLTPAG